MRVKCLAHEHDAVTRVRISRTGLLKARFRLGKKSDKKPGEKGFATCCAQMLHVVNRTRKTVFKLTTFPKTKRRAENTTRIRVLLTKLKVFGNAVKHCLKCLTIFPIETKTKEETEK